MIIIGITGGSGSGKTSALEAFKSRGAFVIDADKVYHRLLREEPEMLIRIESRFPGAVICGKLDTKKLGERVYGDPEALRDLNSITHGFVLSEFDKMISSAKTDGFNAVVIDAVALFESGANLKCHFTVGVIAPIEDRISRIAHRDNIDLKYAKLRISAQKPDSFFRNNCDFILENTGTASQFLTKAISLFDNILRNGDKLMSENKACDAKSEDSKLRREKVLYRGKNAYDLLPKNELGAVEECARKYRLFSDNSKTERDAVCTAVRMAHDSGFREFKRGEALKSGDKVYVVNRGRAVMLAVIGSESMSRGLNIVAAHIDAPRIDLKTNPLYEDTGLAFFKTHYYGGIKKYQWVALPLELSGVVVLTDGTVVKVEIGKNPDDPVLTITDLLPHLATDQYKKNLSEAVPGENLNVLLGCKPAADDEGEDRVRLAVMELLNHRYGIVEQDLASAELSLVPAFNSRDVGLDASMIGAYGHDDRVCSFTGLQAILSLNSPKRTALCCLVDKEEIGSEGVSGMKSAFFDTFCEDLCAASGVSLREVYENSVCLSADVCAAFDPNYPDAYDKRNCPKLGYGIGVCKYTGSRGKSGASDASAELVARVRKVLADNNIPWQMAPMGKVDLGGGGTVAMYLAQRNIDTIDIGVPVLSMHSPFEICSKVDTYLAYKAFCAFYTDN